MTDQMGQELAMQDCRTEVDAMSVARRQAVRSRANRTERAERQAILTRTVELDVIPRLLAAHGVVPVATPLLVTAAHVTDLVGVVLGRSEVEAVAFIEGVHDQGAPAETIYLDLLAPAARRLGEMWDTDDVDFTEVTIGMWRLQSSMRELGPTFDRSMIRPIAGPRALIVPLPGESHTFGLAMVFEFFRRAGWDAWTGPIASSADLRAMVRHEWVDVIGFSLSCDDKLDVVRNEIRSVRRASLNPALGIMVGGPGFTANPLLAAQVGADGTATDGQQAVLQAQALVDTASRR
ncbi:MAG: cobalamin B12-binding domain-containing protein [Gemmatimonadaceae bacterium]|nr:cobalamin B12-binding domain-containing protein [Acetobacteraceae bacterium]